MRLIAHLPDETSAKTFAGYLGSLDIRHQIEPDSGAWAIWIHSEDQIEAGRQALSSYLKNPNDAKFRRAAEASAALEKGRERDAIAAAKRIRTSDQLWNRSGHMPLTYLLIAASVLVTVLASLSPRLEDVLLISESRFGWLTEVRTGQVWRLITPIFLHFGLTHILFNMWMLRDLGGMLEIRQGTKKLAVLVLVLAVGSNLGQYMLDNIHPFGGMSGVLYGLFGYIWIRGQSDPGSGLGLSQMTVAIMLIWFVLCLAGFLGNVANGTHAVGLIMGMIWGSIPWFKRWR